ncbi:mannan-binding lectin [Shewanella glacialimarina]|uniref:mannan-binding lectin n=1 Tax=Shewanella glacialimarina TaxID=2590884 RepID=UPI001CF86436|nr:mannan-binding lectin [Shewanella glacialimarina]UCX03642.1 mannan-binding protein [Shewanella glacialimarina]
MNRFSKRNISSLVSSLVLCVSGTSIAQANQAAYEKTGSVAMADIAKSKLTAPAGFNCSADASWFTTPSLPAEVKQSNGPGDSSFCDFYQFSWQTFSYLMAKSKTNPDVLNFQDTSQFNELEVNTDGTPANSCDDKHDSHVLFIRSTKPQENGTTFTIPERIGQAGGGATIYDQNENVVYYDVRFSKNMCDVKAIQQKQNFPGGTTELKTAWKVLGANDDPSKFITMDANITPVKADQKDSKTTQLGMVGFHVAVATPNHPEFIWATFEHKQNSPDCTLPESTTDWSFASQACTASLKDNKANCDFNNPTKQTDITGAATEICRMYPYGSSLGDANFDENTGSIKTLNANVQPYLTGDFKVLANYFNVGALWVSDITEGSYITPTNGQPVSQIGNQRGSLRLANTVAETEYQDVNTAAINLNPDQKNLASASSPSAGFVSNCFGCHNYTGTASSASNTTSNSLSHIFDDIAVGSNQCLDVQASNTINSQVQAKADCPSTCTNSSSKLKWNGQWTNQSASTGAQLPQTVCGCCNQ